MAYITDEDGKVENRYAYDAWGNVTESEEGIGNRFRFTGQQYDPVTQQYYLRARFYNPVIARFTQEDTYRGAGLNLYAYCDNNPVAYVDPSGHQPSCVKDAAKKYMEQGMSKEEAYRKAYADHADDKLKDPSNLSAKEKYELEQRQKRLGNQPEASGGTEQFYRTMSEKEYKKLVENGVLTKRDKGASELKVTQESEYTTDDLSQRKNQGKKYTRVVRFDVEKGTADALIERGATHSSASDDFPHLPSEGKGKVEIKYEKNNTLSYGLGSSPEGLELFNNSIKTISVYDKESKTWETIIKK